MSQQTDHDTPNEGRKPEMTCEHTNEPEWMASDALWLRVVGSKDGVLCQKCFTDLAASKGIQVLWRATVYDGCCCHMEGEHLEAHQAALAEQESEGRSELETIADELERGHCPKMSGRGIAAWLRSKARRSGDAHMTTSFWVVEQFTDGKSAGFWDGANSRSFQPDIEKAIQFRRKSDAFWATRGWHWRDTQITEHLYLDSPPPTAAPEPPPDIREQIGKIMHESWCKTKRAQHFHHPDEPCDICGDGKGFCVVHRDLIPWEQLPEKQKDINRHAFDAVLESGILVPAPAPTAAPEPPQESELLRSCKELRDVAAACFRVIYTVMGLSNALEKELARIGIEKGFGVRADAIIAKAEAAPAPTAEGPREGLCAHTLPSEGPHAYTRCDKVHYRMVAPEEPPAAKPTTLEAKWLDPECWEGCQSLKWKEEFARGWNAALERAAQIADGWGCDVSSIEIARWLRAQAEEMQ